MQIWLKEEIHPQGSYDPISLECFSALFTEVLLHGKSSSDGHGCMSEYNIGSQTAQNLLERQIRKKQEKAMRYQLPLTYDSHHVTAREK